MIEFGSDFHFCKNLPLRHTSPDEKWRDGIFFANGRQAIHTLILYRGWKRIWIPRYFCCDIVEAIANTGISVVFYEDYPGMDDCLSISKISFRKGDVLLRMNYFGLRRWRDNSGLDVEVLEDHSHDLSGEWVSLSNADWCIASLRKTLPLSEGGVVWSPKQLRLPPQPSQSRENMILSTLRLEAMRIKTDYLYGKDVDKKLFRRQYVETENNFDVLPISAISEFDCNLLNKIDVGVWNQQKKRNWERLYAALVDKIEILKPEADSCMPFSCVIRGQNLCQSLIDHAIYPAVLWPLPEEYNQNLLSIHCDGRYSDCDVDIMINRIIECLK